MSNRTQERGTGALTLAIPGDRRRMERTAAQLRLMYSGMESGQMLIGDGVVTNLSENGIGILGNRLVKPGNGTRALRRSPRIRGSRLYFGRAGVMGGRASVRG